MVFSLYKRYPKHIAYPITNNIQKKCGEFWGVAGSFVRLRSSFSPKFILWDFYKKKNYGVKNKKGIFFSHHKLKKDGFSKLRLPFHFSTFIFVDFLFPKSLSNFFTFFLERNEELRKMYTTNDKYKRIHHGAREKSNFISNKKGN